MAWVLCFERPFIFGGGCGGGVERTVCVMMLASLSDRPSTGRNVLYDGDTIRIRPRLATKTGPRNLTNTKVDF